MLWSTTAAVQYDSPFSFFKPESFDKLLDWAVETSLDGIEPAISDYNGFDVEAFASKLKTKNLLCSTISTGQSYGREGLSLSDRDSDIRIKARNRIFEHINAASILNSKVTIGILRGKGEYKELLKELEKCADYALIKGVTLLLEPINRYELPLINSAEQGLTVIKELGNPESIGILWDIFHANIEDPGFNEAIDILGTKLSHVHLADSNRLAPGLGHIDFVSIIKKLNNSGYKGFLSFECLCGDLEKAKASAAAFTAYGRSL